jgi:hypothetical protein
MTQRQESVDVTRLLREWARDTGDPTRFLVAAPREQQDGFVCPRCGNLRAYELVKLRHWQM